MLSTKKFTGARQVVTDSHSLSLATRVPRPGPAAGPGLGIAWARAAHFDAPPHRPIPTNRATVTFQFTTTFRGRTIRVPVCTNWGMTTDTPFARAGPLLGRHLEARQAQRPAIDCGLARAEPVVQPRGAGPADSRRHRARRGPAPKGRPGALRAGTSVRRGGGSQCRGWRGQRHSAQITRLRGAQACA